MVESKYISHIGNHQQSRKQEKKITQKHDPTQTTDDEIGSLIALEELHCHKGERTNSKEIGSWLPD